MPSLTDVPEILKASPKDTSTVAPLFDAYRQFYRRPPDLEGARRYLFARLSKGESVLFYATMNSQAAGFVQLYPMFSSVSMRRQWILNDLYVHPDFRRKGVGQALLNTAEKLAETTGANRLILETAMDNVDAQRLYENMGWQRETGLHTYYLPVEQ